MKREVVLSERLRSLADLVTCGNRVCDVGCDHGFLSIFLVQKKISPSVIAMDVRSGPLSRCEEHVREHELEAYIETRLSDGLDQLKIGEADTMICAGMGGRLMMKILTEGRDKAHALKELILQPQSELRVFREFLRNEGYNIVSENMIEEEGKFYPMMKVVYADESKGREIGEAAADVCAEAASGLFMPDLSLQDLFGPLLLANRHPVLKRFLAYRKEVLLSIRESVAFGNDGKRLDEIESELRQIEEAQGYYRTLG